MRIEDVALIEASRGPARRLSTVCGPPPSSSSRSRPAGRSSCSGPRRVASLPKTVTSTSSSSNGRTARPLTARKLDPSGNGRRDRRAVRGRRNAGNAPTGGRQGPLRGPARGHDHRNRPRRPACADRARQGKGRHDEGTADDAVRSLGSPGVPEGQQRMARRGEGGGGGRG